MSSKSGFDGLSTGSLAARAVAKMKRFNYFSDHAVASRLLAAKDINPQAAAIHTSMADQYDQLASLADGGEAPPITNSVA